MKIEYVLFFIVSGFSLGLGAYALYLAKRYHESKQQDKS